MLQKLLALSSLLFALSVSAQQQPPPQLEKVLPIHGFTTVNTTSGLFRQNPSEGSIGINLDLGLDPGSLAKRYGIQSVDTLNGIDSIISIFGASLSDNSQYMVFVVDDSAQGYGSLRVSKKNSFSFDSLTTIYPWWSVLSRSSFQVFQNTLYVFNPDSRGVIYNGRSATTFPMLAPGEPLVVPLQQSGGLNGTYRYAVTRGSSNYVGYFSTTPVTVKNGAVLLTAFSNMPYDSMVPPSATNDTLSIWRTMGDFTPLDHADSIFKRIGRLVVNSGNYASATIVDTMSDATLRSASSNQSVILASVYPPGDTTGTGSALGRYWNPYRYGAPGFVSKADSITHSPTLYSIWSKGSYTTLPDVAGWLWNCTAVDTSLGSESDTGAGLCMLVRGVGTYFNFPYRDSIKAKSARIRLALPRLNDQSLRVNLYRSPIIASSIDSLVKQFPNGNLYIHVGDSITVGDPRFIGQYRPGDTIWDSLPYGNLIGRARYRPNTTYALPSMKGIFEFDGRLWGWSGSRLYLSTYDTGYLFNAFSQIAIAESDGDIITAAVPTPDGVLVLKSKSSYLIYQDANNQWNRTQVSSYLGCIAPQSIARSGRGLYYLSAYGVVRQNTGQYRDRAPSVEIISQSVEQLSRGNITDLVLAQGTIYDQKYILSTPTDTAFVFDEKTGGVTTWEFAINSPTNYAAESFNGFVPLDSLYFLLSSGGSIGANANGKRLWRYGGSEIDSGYQSDFAVSDAPPTWVWRTVPLLTGPGYKSITRIGFYGSGGASDQFTVQLYDETGASVASASVLGIDGKYQEVGFPPTTAKYYQIQIQSSGIVSTGRTVIDGMDVYYTENGNVEVK